MLRATRFGLSRHPMCAPRMTRQTSQAVRVEQTLTNKNVLINTVIRLNNDFTKLNENVKHLASNITLLREDVKGARESTNQAIVDSATRTDRQIAKADKFIITLFTLVGACLPLVWYRIYSYNPLSPYARLSP
ncbi:hypothetical protein B9Z19DRAFT_1084239 [Tuber borchii]|uniref:Uncharacterized protein n=1 Tax=Tuber borchii TaxID=42251 RepID=A0A2T6ZSF1_TUBBO|nr:hypothetical protein B9Z19DRAFT_1084239 [Tuber borchii]